MPCVTDHLTLASKFCPECGWHQLVPREPGEFDAMGKTLEALLVATPSQLGMLVFVTAFATMEWARGNMPTEVYLTSCRRAMGVVERAP